MNRNPTSLIISYLLFIAHTASAASDRDQSSTDSLSNTLISYLPIAIFLVVLFAFFRRLTKSPVAKLQQQYLERQIQHTRRVEELLERIASSLEKK